MGKNSHKRNSNVELLRLLSMGMIIFYHLVSYNPSIEDGSYNRIDELIIHSPYISMCGEIGNVLFFSISIWYLSESRKTLLKSLKSVWVFDRQVIFYSTLLYIVYYMVSKQLNIEELLCSFIPLLNGTWWFITAYAILYLLMPFVSVGLKALTDKEHKQLCVLAITLYSIFAFIFPGIEIPKSGQDLSILLTLAIVITYIRFRVDREKLIHQRKRLAITIFSGIITSTILKIVSMCYIPILSAVANRFIDDLWVFSNILILSVAVPIFLLVISLPEQNSRLIDYLAGSTLAAYLITEYPFIRSLLWKEIFTFSHITWRGQVIVPALLCSVCVPFGAILIDQLRRALFALTIDKHPGKIFNSIELTFAKKL
ncbi:acyltransferase family protein [Bifidobacterium olomucense]